MELSEINQMCFKVINYYKMNDFYHINYNNNEKEPIYLLKKLLLIIDSKLIDSLNNDCYSYYYIYLFCINYKEQLITKKDIQGLIDNVNFTDYFSILQMNKELDNDLIIRIYDLINSNESLYLGNLPYDYRYHIIRRKEASKELINKVIKDYTKEELNNTLYEIKEDIGFEKMYYDEMNIDNINDKYLSDKNRVYKRLIKCVK